MLHALGWSIDFFLLRFGGYALTALPRERLPSSFTPIFSARNQRGSSKMPYNFRMAKVPRVIAALRARESSPLFVPEEQSIVVLPLSETLDLGEGGRSEAECNIS